MRWWTYDHPRHLRAVEIALGDEVFRLVLREAGLNGEGRAMVAYQFGPSGGEPIFTGADFAPSPMIAIDGDEAVRDLLAFLSLRPGWDLEDEYFVGYTPEQRAFAEEYGEELSLYVDEDAPVAWRDVGRTT